jgi:hypothetical protein
MHGLKTAWIVRVSVTDDIVPCAADHAPAVATTGDSLEE